jgi:hypothetical protein
MSEKKTRAKGGGRKKVGCENLPVNVPFRRSDVAKIIGCSLPSVDRMVEDGVLQIVKIKGSDTKYLMRKDG